MCNDCVFTAFPDRGTTSLDNGSYLLNLKACCSCEKRSLIRIDNKDCINEDGKEIIKYQHICPNCQHVIAEHEYTFGIEEAYQVYTMECLLCGCGESLISIMPDDPREQIAHNGY